MRLQLQINAVSKVLTFATIILIAAFQCYWITKLYKDEWQGLKRETDVLFRDVVYKLQIQRFKSDTSFYKKGAADNLFMIDLINSALQKAVDSSAHRTGKETDTMKKHLLITVNTQKLHQPGDIYSDTITYHSDNFNMPLPQAGPGMMIRKFTGNKMLTDSLPLSKIDSAYKAELTKNSIPVAYVLRCIPGKNLEAKQPPIKSDELKTNFAFVGISSSYAYQAAFDNPFNYLIKKLASSILISFLLISFTIASFVFLYRNLITQKKLANIKNEFISNITHELKTPIATVNVAIEALRNFNALQDPAKTKEYLDISAAELQRLSLLVDKVLRLSMFENREVELKKETFDLKVLTEEVIGIMRLQFDKQQAVITFITEGENFIIEADRMHITSVLYNLLDNALKYKKQDAEIEVLLKSHRMHVEVKVKDNGIGIPAEYKSRVFEKFFRVPTSDVHNTKGYGLGLSYVNHIIQRHRGYMYVESELGKGSTFIVNIPYIDADEIWFDDKRCIRRKNIL